ncbi:hypothetical protein [Zhihengliuella salsuginis]|uniref:Uncharacterized protein n=1 Tax=Zhihengliuella salsuginis TaxID=578222 RepID=A0ABQ3GHL3_9MICC|nr:hypothetical protein [Zhihengliuella salsuginis]GHD07147.1 hypothetical protein GCM10008096_17610 [Zhihengliuella salsuginis]
MTGDQLLIDLLLHGFAVLDDDDDPVLLRADGSPIDKPDACTQAEEKLFQQVVGPAAAAVVGEGEEFQGRRPA